MIQRELEHVRKQHEELGRSGLEAEVKLVVDLGTEVSDHEETEEKELQIQNQNLTHCRP